MTDPKQNPHFYRLGSDTFLPHLSAIQPVATHSTQFPFLSLLSVFPSAKCRYPSQEKNTQEKLALAPERFPLTAVYLEALLLVDVRGLGHHTVYFPCSRRPF